MTNGDDPIADNEKDDKGSAYIWELRVFLVGRLAG